LVPRARFEGWEVALWPRGRYLQDDPSTPGTFPQLYNVTADPSETVNLAADLPAEVKAMELRLAELASSSVEPMQV
jgi:arylsulfatase A-like enzyme